MYGCRGPDADPSYGPDLTVPGPSGVVEDLAFADTVVALDDVVPPASSLIVAGEPVVVPLTYVETPVVMAPPTGPWGRLRHGARAAWEELKQLWNATACLEEVHDANGAVIRDPDPFVRAATVGRRVRRLFSFFEWDRADVLRAAWIGLAVFVLATTIGAICLQLGSAPDALPSAEWAASPR
jgi:hypothetical protein